mgnify:CR=1 FL=1
MSRVVLPHAFEAGDVVNPEYVNENFEALSEAANSLGASNLPARTVPQSAIESPVAVGQILVPIGVQYASLAWDDGDEADDVENLLVLPIGSRWHYAGTFPVDISIKNVAWCLQEFSGEMYGHIVVNDAPWVEIGAAAFDTFIPAPSVPEHEWDVSSPRWVDNRDCSLGWNANQHIWVGVQNLRAEDGGDADPDYLYQNMSITLTYSYKLFP